MGGSVAYPCLPMDQMNAFPPSLSTLRKVEVDMGMDSCWQCLSTGVPQGHSLDMSPKAHEEDSGLSTDTPLLQDTCSSSSDDEEPALALQAQEIREEEERIMSSGFHATSERWLAAPLS